MDKNLVSELFAKIMAEGLGLDLNDPNLTDTPRRVAKMYCDELFIGLNSPEPKSTTFPNDKEYNQMILSDKIYFNSLCSHHFLPFSGYAWILYIPNEKLIGLSKFSRITTWFASRPQLQENLTHEIMTFLVNKLNPKGVMVVMRALHQCMHCRGVKQHSGAGMVTSSIYGVFEEEKVRIEAMNLIQLSNMQRE